MASSIGQGAFSFAPQNMIPFYPGEPLNGSTSGIGGQSAEIHLRYPAEPTHHFQYVPGSNRFKRPPIARRIYEAKGTWGNATYQKINMVKQRNGVAGYLNQHPISRLNKTQMAGRFTKAAPENARIPRGGNIMRIVGQMQGGEVDPSSVMNTESLANVNQATSNRRAEGIPGVTPPTPVEDVPVVQQPPQKDATIQKPPSPPDSPMSTDGNNNNNNNNNAGNYGITDNMVITPPPGSSGASSEHYFVIDAATSPIDQPKTANTGTSPIDQPKTKDTASSPINPTETAEAATSPLENIDETLHAAQQEIEKLSASLNAMKNAGNITYNELVRITQLAIRQKHVLDETRKELGQMKGIGRNLEERLQYSQHQVGYLMQLLGKKEEEIYALARREGMDMDRIIHSATSSPTDSEGYDYEPENYDEWAQRREQTTTRFANQTNESVLQSFQSAFSPNELQEAFKIANVSLETVQNAAAVIIANITNPTVNTLVNRMRQVLEEHKVHEEGNEEFDSPALIEWDNERVHLIAGIYRDLVLTAKLITSVNAHKRNQTEKMITTGKEIEYPAEGSSSVVKKDKKKEKKKGEKSLPPINTNLQIEGTKDVVPYKQPLKKRKHNRSRSR